ncbi:MAG: hypothetical protein KAQ85_07680, partial [Thermodesulfovibrionia bacterium]|nr:hypothetical protein [Thermodesulfovibrionia bacterium]
MKLSTKIILLTTSVALSVAFLIIISIRGVVVNAFRAELQKKAVSLAGNLSESIANPVLLKDHFQTTKALNEVLKREKDLEYIFVTDEEGNIFAHTFHNGTPPDILSWNPLNNRTKNIQLLDTEKGYIRDVAVTIFDGTKSELHLGIKETSIKSVLSKMRNIT